MDAETGLYYFGGRYYDPRTSVWQSADPVTEDYLDSTTNSGVYKPMNLASYSYSFLNPVTVTDPDGNAAFSQYELKMIERKLIKFEKFVPHMYIDSTGNMTVGYGLNMNAMADPTSIPMYMKGSGKRATPEQIQAEMDNLRFLGEEYYQKHGHYPTSKFYQKHATMTMKKSDARKYLREHIRNSITRLENLIPGFDNLPTKVRFALVDMMYNMGDNFTRKCWHRFFNALDNKDWAKMAKESERGQVGKERNAYVRNLLNAEERDTDALRKEDLMGLPDNF